MTAFGTAYAVSEAGRSCSGRNRAGFDLDPPRRQSPPMCSHYRKDPTWRAENEDWSEIRIPPRWSRLGPPPNAEMKTHVGPGAMGEFLVPEGDQLLALAGNWRWVPPDHTGSYKAYGRDKESMGRNNCRSEYADTTKTWKEVAKAGRCIIPLNAFYEWDKGQTGKKVEHEFTLPDGRLMFAAGLWDRSEHVEEGPMVSFSMLTKGPGGDTASIGHHRQALILRDDEIEDYLDPTNPIYPFSQQVDPLYTFTIRPVERKPKAAAEAGA
jgi:putative SOS response-associated peptidase YedK